jgi:nucleoside-diphosphate-sugar epimerase
MSLSVAEIVDKIQAVAGTRLPVVSDIDKRRQEIPNVMADITLAQQVLGWRPMFTFEHGIRAMFADTNNLNSLIRL